VRDVASELRDAFVQRHDVAHEWHIAAALTTYPETVLRNQPHPAANTVVWNIWHALRVEDIGISRFVADTPQLHARDGWEKRLRTGVAHNGSGMPLSQVVTLSAQIDIAALHAYAQAVRQQTVALLAALPAVELTHTWSDHHIAHVLDTEGVAHHDAAALVAWYQPWSRARWLLSSAGTHLYEHIGAYQTLAGLHGWQEA
jgi:hypothetical protein